jgi:shikimate dehydrogenase
MRQFGLIGYPLSHSFSKKYFTDKFKNEQIADCSYELYPLRSIDDLPALLRETPGLAGFNITIPYKESVLTFLSGASQAVQEIGACNCVRIEKGKLIGFNTDVTGFEQTLLPHLRPHQKKALILGTGGAAKAVAWVFKQHQIAYQNVSRQKGVQCIEYKEVTKEVLEEYTIVVNTTPLGMQPNVNDCPSVNFEWVNATHLCIDLIYNPLKTVFLARAEQSGANIVNGLEMLMIQAEESWKIWNDLQNSSKGRIRQVD